VTFENWYDENLKTMLKEHNLHSALEWAWKTAQEAERERMTEEKDWLIERIRFLEKQIAERNK
jgi:ribosomal protein S19E (S16A)